MLRRTQFQLLGLVTLAFAVGFFVARLTDSKSQAGKAKQIGALSELGEIKQIDALSYLRSQDQTGTLSQPRRAKQGGGKQVRTPVSFDELPPQPSAQRDLSALPPQQRLEHVLADDMLARERSDNLATLFKEWAASDPASAFAAAANLSRKKYRYECLDAVLSEYAAKNAQDGLRQLAGLALGKDQLKQLYANFFEIWSSRDMKAALQAWETLRDGPNGDFSLGGVMRVWAGRDPDSALVWIGKNLKDKTSETAAKVVLASMAERAPERAAAYVETLPKENRFEMAQAMLDVWTYDQPNEARAWAKKALVGEERELALSMIAQ